MLYSGLPASASLDIGGTRRKPLNPRAQLINDADPYVYKPLSDQMTAAIGAGIINDWGGAQPAYAATNTRDLGGSNAGTEGDLRTATAAALEATTPINLPGGNAFQGIPTGQLENAWGDPEALLRLYAQKRGMVGPGGAEVTLQQLANSIGILWMIANDRSGKGDDEKIGTKQFLSWLSPELDKAMKPGSSLMDSPTALMHTLLNPQGGTLQGYLGTSGSASESMTRGDAVDNMLSAVQYALKPGTPTPVLNSILNALASSGRAYRAAQLTGNHPTESFADFSKRNNDLGGFAF